jgi:hypothetical protein
MLLRATVLLLLTAVAIEPAAAGSTNANASSTPVPIQVANDDAQRSACTPDVFRLCSQFIPDVDNIVGCLKMQRPNLSPACRAVFH